MFGGRHGVGNGNGEPADVAAFLDPAVVRDGRIHFVNASARSKRLGGPYTSRLLLCETNALRIREYNWRVRMSEAPTSSEEPRRVVRMNAEVVAGSVVLSD